MTAMTYIAESAEKSTRGKKEYSFSLVLLQRFCVEKKIILCALFSCFSGFYFPGSVDNWLNHFRDGAEVGDF